MDGASNLILKDNIDGNLIKVGGDSEDQIFTKENVFLEKMQMIVTKI